MDGGGCPQRLRRTGSAGVWRWRAQTATAISHQSRASLGSGQQHEAAA